jgi:hypothetical protein
MIIVKKRHDYKKTMLVGGAWKYMDNQELINRRISLIPIPAARLALGERKLQEHAWNGRN